MAARGDLSTGLLLLLALQLLQTLSEGAASACTDEDSCQSHMQSLIERLAAQRENMTGKHQVLDSLESLRNGIVSGERVELPSTHKQHLEKTSPLVGYVAMDSKHKAVSTNISRHLRHIRNVADEVNVHLHTIMPLKRPSGQKIGPSALLISVDTNARLWIHTLEGDLRLSNFDLGHGEGRTIERVTLSPNQDNHFVVTSDDEGEVRVHSLKVIAKKAEEKKEEEFWNESGNETDEEDKPDEKPEEKFEMKHGIKQLVVTANFTTSFRIPPSAKGEERKLNTVLLVDRGSQMFFVTGDSLGGIAIFHRNGTMKGRVKVTEDPGGVKGLMRGQSNTVLFYSSHLFGFLSVSQVDVQNAPCAGWNSPLFDIAPDPTHSYQKVILALEDGDVLVFSTTRGKQKACDLTLKFPRVSALPYKLHVFRGHVIGLPTPLETAPRKDEYLRELLFFNLAEMEAGYGTSATRTVTLQANFKPKRPDSFSLFSGGGSADRSKVQLSIHFKNETGVGLYELSLKQPPAPKAASSQGDGSSWLDWFPKVGVFGIAMVGVVIWNVRKMSGGGGPDDFDEDAFKASLKKAKKGGDFDGLGDLGGLDSMKDGLGGLGAGLDDGDFDDD
mmetsp:Transcript_28164/g.45275  ORF Transcript_28164/g.45275 Transcript_28164/m.45275 type:complete len:613 (-) Transcript_28164:97-1935(-)